jgi:hypothetical protein
MQWQDWVLSVGAFAILVSLVPTIRGEQKPALTTSIMSTVIVATFGVTMATLGLWLSALANVLISAAWALLAYQRYAATQRERKAGVLAQIEAEVEVSLGMEDEASATEARPA